MNKKYNRSFSPNEKIFNGIGFTISVDILRNLIKEETTDKKKILLLSLIHI